MSPSVIKMETSVLLGVTCFNVDCVAWRSERLTGVLLGLTGTFS